MSTIAQEPIVYPESDGEPMAENTRQFRWIVTIVGGLRSLFADRPDVFIAGDLFWYPVEGRPDIRTAPDAMVAIGRPQGERGSYMQWREGGIAPQVVFEVLSPGNSGAEMERKLRFYEGYGVREYYIYDPDTNTLSGWRRDGAGLEAVDMLQGWVSPLLGIRFVPGPEELELQFPDGRPFLSYEALFAQHEQERARAEQLAARAEQLAAQLRALGIDPDAEPR